MEPGLRRATAIAVAGAAVVMMFVTSPARASGVMHSQLVSTGPALATTPIPTFTGFSPRKGPMGTKVTIIGAGFRGTTKVWFHGKPAAFKVVSNTRISALVPCGTSSGRISVFTPNGIVRSATSFKIT